MILQALVHLYDELCKQGKIAQEGWGVAKVSHRLILSRDGTLQGVVSAKKKVMKGKKEVEVPADMQVPTPVIRSSGVKANFLCDNSSYFFGVDDKGKPARSRQCFEAAKEKHHEILDDCHSPVAKSILRFFDTWDVEKAAENPIVKENWEDILKASYFIFQVDGKDAQEDEAIREAWQNHLGSEKEDSAEAQGICLVTGEENQAISILHPKIKGVLGAQSSGANLVSFNATSFCSYGYDGEQGKNAPISEKAAAAYGKALNYLLADKTHAKQIGDTTVVYWSEHALTACQDCFMNFWDDSSDGMDDQTLDEIMKRLRDGLSVSLEGIEISPDEPFYILGLSPNASRLSVRFFLTNTFGEILRHLGSHQERMRLEGPDWEKKTIPLWRIIKAAANPKADGTGLSPLLSGSLMRSILLDVPYPEAVFQHVMMRIFADSDKPAEKGKTAFYKIDHIRAAFIKAYLLKNRSNHWEGQIQMAVNENCENKAYVLGRLFAVLENIQQSANPNINATIKDRYFNAACATPATVFPVLLKLSNAHLGKLERGKEISFKKKLGALLEKIPMPDQGTPIPARLSLEEQGAFVLGYYQETQSRFAGKENAEKQEEK